MAEKFGFHTCGHDGWELQRFLEKNSKFEWQPVCALIQWMWGSTEWHVCFFWLNWNTSSCRIHACFCFRKIELSFLLFIFNTQWQHIESNEDICTVSKVFTGHTGSALWEIWSEMKSTEGKVYWGNRGIDSWDGGCSWKTHMGCFRISCTVLDHQFLSCAISSVVALQVLLVLSCQMAYLREHK